MPERSLHVQARLWKAAGWAEQLAHLASERADHRTSAYLQLTFLAHQTLSWMVQNGICRQSDLQAPLIRPLQTLTSNGSSLKDNRSQFSGLIF
jgi:hypothetical protein